MLSRGRITLCLLALAGCKDERDENPPPIGPGTNAATIGSASAGVSTGGAESTGSSTDGSSGSSSGTSGPVETGSDTPCGDWAERYVGCIGAGVVSELEQQCDAELADWEEPLPSCRVLAEDLLVCVTQQPCQPFVDWERNRAIPPECAAELDALEQMCSFIGTTGG